MKSDVKSDEKYLGRGQTLEMNQSLITETVSTAARQMQESSDESKRIPLTDLASVRRIAQEYLALCAGKSQLPTVTGLAARLGRSRSSLYKERNNAFHEFLEDFSDICGETLSQSMLYGGVAAVPGIFVLKSRYQWREAPITIETAAPIGPLVQELSPEQIAEKYSYLPDD